MNLQKLLRPGLIKFVHEFMKLPNLEWKTQHKQLLRYPPLAFGLPTQLQYFFGSQKSYQMISHLTCEIL